MKSLLLNAFLFLSLILIAETTSKDIIINNIKFQGNSFFSANRLQQLLYINDDSNFNVNDINSIINNIGEIYLSYGFLFATVEVIEIITNDDVNTAVIQIKEGGYIRSENFLFNGNKTTKEQILIKLSGITKDQIITKKIIDDARKRIEKKQYIKSCEIIPVDNNNILFNITEASQTRLTGLLGYASKSENTNINGFLLAQFYNIFGTDRNLSLNWKNYSETNFFSIDYHDSGPINYPVSFDISLSREEIKNNYTKAIINTDAVYNLEKIDFGITAGLTNYYPITNINQSENKIKPQTDKKIGFLVMVDNKDDNYNPKTGSQINLDQSVLLVNKNDISFKRYLTKANVQNYTPINNYFVLYNAISFINLTNKNLSQNDLIKIGGTFSLRSFYEDELMGNKIFYTNTELRYLFSRQSLAFTFLDYGYIEDERPEYKNRINDAVGMGIGLRIWSKICLLRIDYGFRHLNKEFSSPFDGLVHFGFEAEF